jgi:membrane protein
LFTFSGLMLEKALRIFSKLPWFLGAANWAASLVISTLSIALFYRTFSPTVTRWKYILIGSFVTASLWSAMRPAFSLFLVINHSYGTIFGGMKNLFLSIGWLYYGFVVFLIGIEIIAALHKRDVLMLRGLFMGHPSHQDLYHSQLMNMYGRTYTKNQVVFREGDAGNFLFYVLSGEIAIRHAGAVLRKLGAGDYFGEMAFLTSETRTADAVVESDTANIIAISPSNLEMLMLEEPKVAMGFLKDMALRLKASDIREAH